MLFAAGHEWCSASSDRSSCIVISQFPPSDCKGELIASVQRFVQIASEISYHRGLSSPPDHSLTASAQMVCYVLILIANDKLMPYKADGRENAETQISQSGHALS